MTDNKHTTHPLADHLARNVLAAFVYQHPPEFAGDVDVCKEDPSGDYITVDIHSDSISLSVIDDLAQSTAKILHLKMRNKKIVRYGATNLPLEPEQKPVTRLSFRVTD